MSAESKGRLRCWFWRGGLFLLVVLPFLPEIVTLVTTIHAEVIGCHAGSKTACEVGPSSAAEIIRAALQAGFVVGSKFGDGLAVAWLALCFFLIIQGWSRLSSRLLLALGVSLIFAFVPYFGPRLSIEHLVNPNCYPNEGLVGPCMIYGGNVGSVAHETVRLEWRIIDGAPIALGTFLVFVVVAIVIRLISTRRVAPSAQ